MTNALIWAAAGLIAVACGACLWWGLRGIRKGHEAGPEIERLEGERDEANEQSERLAAPPPSPRGALRTLRRLLDDRNR